jgi:hypothetical protein
MRIRRAVSVFRDILPQLNGRYTVRLLLMGTRQGGGPLTNSKLYWSCGRALEDHEHELYRAREFALQTIRDGYARNFHIVEGHD